MDIGELKEILRKHKAWLDGEPDGKRADLSEANLCRADLSEANLRGADLCRADLYEVNLRGADLSKTDLSKADLRRTNLRGADLSEANLRGADLCRADLYEVNLSGADLRGADLSEANLRGADLYEAKAPYIPMACPDSGAFIGWKKAQDCIVKLLIPEDARRLSATRRKCRCDKAIVLAITKLDGTVHGSYEVNSTRDLNFIYEVGKTVEADGFDENRWNECSSGIHFFINRQEAVDY